MLMEGTSPDQTLTFEPLPQSNKELSCPQSLPPQICYGAICDVQMRLRKRQTVPLSDLLSCENLAEESVYMIFQCRLNDHGCAITTNAGHAFADLDKRSSRALSDLCRPSPLKYEAILTVRMKANIINSTDQDRFFTIDINISGPPSEADRVAMQLYQEDLFLQDPLWFKEGEIYKNPQHLDIPDVSNHGHNSSLPPDSDTLEEIPSMETISTAEIVTDFAQLLDSFAQHADLTQDVDVLHINTELMSHQKEGLNFIMQREIHTSPLSSGLWKLIETGDDQPCYQHVITGGRSQSPNDASGGIIADDMGLGKTLTMIAAIVRSLANAYDYARLMYVPERTPIAAKSTLIVVPSALLMENWVDEIKTRTVAGSLDYHKFHGSSRNIPWSYLLQNDIVLTTYGTLAADYNRQRSLLHRISWYRVVLDEAHAIRNPSTKQFAAVNDLNSLHRWCLTGTPIQNSLEDLGSLVRFLRLPVLADPGIFRQHIVCKTQLNKSINDKDFANLKALLGSICLRRNRALLSIAEPEQKIYELDFSREERADYSSIERACQEALDLAVSGHKSKEAHQSVLKTLLRLRLFCNNGTVFGAPIHPVTGLPTDPEEAMSFLQHSGQVKCHYCGSEVDSLRAPDDPTSALLTTCRHVICNDCLPQHRDESNGGCSLCHTQHSLASATTTLDITEQLRPDRTYPTKMLMLCNDIQKHRLQGKSVVFSFWKKSLDIVNYLLTSRGVHVVRIDGSVPFNKRKTILKNFQDSQGGLVLLMTLGTGSEGLNNLSNADSVHILEPQWNPSVEKQAIGRVLRLGRSKPATIVQYIMNKTVEKTIQRRQLGKLSLVQGGFGGKNGKETKETAALFRSLICADSAC